MYTLPGQKFYNLISYWFRKESCSNSRAINKIYRAFLGIVRVKLVVVFFKFRFVNHIHGIWYCFYSCGWLLKEPFFFCLKCLNTLLLRCLLLGWGFRCLFGGLFGSRFLRCWLLGWFRFSCGFLGYLLDFLCCFLSLLW